MENNVNDNGGFLWGLLGCCIPIVGLILFLVWKDQTDCWSDIIFSMERSETKNCKSRRNWCIS